MKQLSLEKIAMQVNTKLMIFKVAKRHILLVMILLYKQDAIAQHMVGEQYYNFQKSGMNTLGTWGLGTMVVSIPFLNQNGEVGAYHKSNFAWGSINALIAAYGRHQWNKKLKTKSPLNQQQIRKTANIYLINGILDIGYIGAGWWVYQQPSQTGKNKGFGKSIFVQGAALFVFDVGMYLKTKSFLARDVHLMANGNGLTFQVGL